MAEIYRVEKGSEEWKYKAYDYVRTDAFCLGQNIPIELEFGQDESKDDLQAILLTEDHKPVAGCRIAFPAEKTASLCSMHYMDSSASIRRNLNSVQSP